MHNQKRQRNPTAAAVDEIEYSAMGSPNSPMYVADIRAEMTRVRPTESDTLRNPLSLAVHASATRSHRPTRIVYLLPSREAVYDEHIPDFFLGLTQGLEKSRDSVAIYAIGPGSTLMELQAFTSVKKPWRVQGSATR